MKEKKRLDNVLCELGHFESRERAKAAIMSGDVYVNNQKAYKAGFAVCDDDVIEVRAPKLKYVGRGGLKLEKALNVFNISPKGMEAIDVGASTGGFTDCLLQNGAAHVHAVDVGYGDLAWSIRNDERVTVMERTNIRYVSPEDIGVSFDIAVIDVSFISLRIVLPAVKALMKPNGKIICLVKPQFEAGREMIGKNGIIKDPKVHLFVLEKFSDEVHNMGLYIKGMDYSPITGSKGNIEFLAYLSLEPDSVDIDPQKIVEAAHEEHLSHKA